MLSVAGARQQQKSGAIFASIGEICGLATEGTEVTEWIEKADGSVFFCVIYVFQAVFSRIIPKSADALAVIPGLTRNPVDKPSLL